MGDFKFEIVTACGLVVSKAYDELDAEHELAYWSTEYDERLHIEPIKIPSEEGQEGVE